MTTRTRTRTVDHTGTNVGDLTALVALGSNRHGQTFWRYRCKCGKTRDAIPANVRRDLRETGKADCGQCGKAPERPTTTTTAPTGHFGAWHVGDSIPDTDPPAWRCRCKGCDRDFALDLSLLRSADWPCCPDCLDRTDLRMLRLCANLTIADAASRAGVSRQHWHQLERAEKEGRVLSDYSRRKALAALGLVEQTVQAPAAVLESVRRSCVVCGGELAGGQRVVCSVECRRQRKREWNRERGEKKARAG